jgi:hypothetical protein
MGITAHARHFHGRRHEPATPARSAVTLATENVRGFTDAGVMMSQLAAILVTDLVGSTELRAQIGEDRADAVRRGREGPG